MIFSHCLCAGTHRLWILWYTSITCFCVGCDTMWALSSHYLCSYSHTWDLLRLPLRRGMVCGLYHAMGPETHAHHISCFLLWVAQTLWREWHTHPGHRSTTLWLLLMAYAWWRWNLCHRSWLLSGGSAHRTHGPIKFGHSNLRSRHGGLAWGTIRLVFRCIGSLMLWWTCRNVRKVGFAQRKTALHGFSYRSSNPHYVCDDLLIF